MSTVVAPTFPSAAEAFEPVAAGVLVLLALVAAACVALLTHHAVSWRRRRDEAERIAVASQLVAPAAALEEASLAQSVRHAQGLVGSRAVASVLRSLRGLVRGELAGQLSRHLEDLGEVERLVRLSSSRRVWLRREAARGLAECGGPSSRARLVRLLSDRDAEVRRAARAGLVAEGPGDGLWAAIQSYLADAQHPAWPGAFHSLLAAVAPDDLRGLVERGVFRGRDERLALDALGQVGDTGATELAAERLSSADPEIRAAAARTLGKLRADQHRDALRERLGDEAWFVRAIAAQALARLGPDLAVDAALSRSLRDAKWWVRRSAARALVSRGEPGIQQLRIAQAGDDRFARDAALVALSFAPLERAGAGPWAARA